MPGLRLFFVWAAVWAALVCVSHWLLGGFPGVMLAIALALLAWDTSLGSLIVASGLRQMRMPPTPAARQPLSVCIAAFNEAACIEATVRSVLTQEGVAFEVLVGDDGSSDATRQIVEKAFAHDSRVRLFALEHGGKAPTLNALLAEAKHSLIVTIDADTLLLPLALARLSENFSTPQDIAAGGVLLVENSQNWLTRFQYSEYIRMDNVAAAWQRLGALEQIPGAFAAFRRDALIAVGGFPTDSITEDYEVVFRLYDRAAQERTPIRVALVPGAVALTHAPVGLGAFFRQRRRWFAGFLLTLFRFRHLIGRPRAGRFGTLKLPLKMIDALIPLAGFYFLATVLRSASLATSPRENHFAWGLLAARWLWDASCYAAILRSAEKHLPLKPGLWKWAHAFAEALTFAWLRYFIALAAYPFAFRHRSDWVPARHAV